MSRLKPVAVDVEEAVVGPIAWGDKEDEEEHGAVDTRPIEEVCQKEERHDESDAVVNTNAAHPYLDRNQQWRCIRRYEKERQPAECLFSKCSHFQYECKRNVYLRKQNMVNQRFPIQQVDFPTLYRRPGGFYDEWEDKVRETPSF